MSLFGVIASTFAQLMLTYLMFMIAVFSSAGLANGRSFGKFATTLLNLSVLVLPSLCLISAGIIIYLYSAGGDGSAYWWHTLPIFGMTLYFICFYFLSHKKLIHKKSP